MKMESQNVITSVPWTQGQQPYYYWLCRVQGIGSKTALSLLAQAGSPEHIYESTEQEQKQWRERNLLSERQLQNLCAARRERNLHREHETLQKRGISMYPLSHPDYPASLRLIPDPPAVLFGKGRLPDQEKPSVAIIGARSCSLYGRTMAYEFARALAKEGVQIISGMARGIDGIGQKAALQAGGYSCGVLGCGVDICYPKENQELYDGLLKQGGILSEYLPGTQPKPVFFPPRNRIISGLADALLVVEARQKSGTLITVDMALEQGREVYVLPGRIGDPLSQGCNQLIAQGAAMAFSPRELLDNLYAGTRLFREGQHQNPRKGSKPAENTDKPQVFACSESAGPDRTEALTEQERALYEVLDLYPKGPEQLRREYSDWCGQSLTPAQLMDLLVRLCMKGAACREPAGGFRKNAQFFEQNRRYKK